MDSLAQDSADSIAQCVLDVFEKLPGKCKPRIYEDGKREWTTLSGIVLSKEDNHVCTALGTGMRCLPADRVALANGLCLHDWHAEIVAIRSFNAFLIHECSLLAANASTESAWLHRRPVADMTDEAVQPFAIRDDVHIDMYSSETPCGDASMELVMQTQDDSTPWIGESTDVQDGLLSGRAHFDRLGVVRRKPARADAPETKSKSCSDKLALKQCTSLLCSPASLLIHPGNAYIRSLVLPSQQVVPAAIERCFSDIGRMSPMGSIEVTRKWMGGYGFRPFIVTETSRAFKFRKSCPDSDLKPVGSNISTVWTPFQAAVLIGGTKQGFKQFSARGRTFVTRGSIWGQCLKVASMLRSTRIISDLSRDDYNKVKLCDGLRARRRVKEAVKELALKGWIPNEGDAGFGLIGDL